VTCCNIELKACPLQATDTPQPALIETNSKRKIAMLYVLDSLLQSGKAREKQTKEMDPDIIKSMQRFCNAVAVGLPTLVRSTQNDPGCYAKTLKVCCSPSSGFSQFQDAICMLRPSSALQVMLACHPAKPCTYCGTISVLYLFYKSVVPVCKAA